MSNKKLAVLAIIAAVMVVWAAVQSRVANRAAETAATGGVYLMQGIDPAMIGNIVVQADGNTVTLARQGNNFVVLEKNNYPAQTKQINSLITSWLDMQGAELITTNKANFADLGVSDEKPEKAIKFLKTDKSLITGILVGKESKDVPGSYVRVIGSDKAYLATNVPWVQSMPIDYIDKNLTDIKREDITKVSVKAPNGNYVIKSTGAKGETLENVPPGKKEKLSDVDQVFVAITNCPFDDVRKAGGDLNFARTFICELKDSTVYTFNIAEKDGKTFAKCMADFTDKSEVLKDRNVESQEELKAKEAKLLARDKAQAFAKKTEGWVYEIPEWKAKNLKMKFADLIEDIPEPNEPADANQIAANE